jgi:hypothetical protein
MRSSLIVLGVGVAIAATLAACDQATEPMIAIIPSVIGSGRDSTPPLQISPNAVQIPIGGSALLQTNAPLSLRNQVQWLSRQPNVASVTPGGAVTAFLPGVATIVARYAFDTTRAATATITVLGPSIPANTGGTTGAGNP